MPEPDCFLRYRISAVEFYVGKIPRIRIGGPPLQRSVVLKWLYSPSRRNTSVGGTCDLPSVLLVFCSYSFTLSMLPLPMVNKGCQMFSLNLLGRTDVGDELRALKPEELGTDTPAWCCSTTTQVNISVSQR